MVVSIFQPSLSSDADINPISRCCEARSKRCVVLSALEQKALVSNSRTGLAVQQLLCEGPCRQIVILKTVEVGGNNCRESESRACWMVDDATNEGYDVGEVSPGPN